MLHRRMSLAVLLSLAVALFAAPRDARAQQSAPAAQSGAQQVYEVIVQTGVRMERRTLKVLKGLAEYLDLSLGDLLEGIVLHAFEGKSPFSDKTLRQIMQFKSIYGLDLTAADAHKLVEEGGDGR